MKPKAPLFTDDYAGNLAELYFLISLRDVYINLSHMNRQSLG